jgi:cell division protein FtsL
MQDLKNLWTGREKVIEQGSRGMKDVFRYILAIIIILAPLFLAVYVMNKVTQLGYKVSELNKIKNQVLLRNEKLTSMFSSLTTPEKIEKLAKKLSFSIPSPSQLVIIEKPGDGEEKIEK